MNLTLNIWRQANTASAGEMQTYQVEDSPPTCRSSRCSTC